MVNPPLKAAGDDIVYLFQNVMHAWTINFEKRETRLSIPIHKSTSASSAELRYIIYVEKMMSASRISSTVQSTLGKI